MTTIFRQKDRRPNYSPAEQLILISRIWEKNNDLIQGFKYFNNLFFN
jgi:hypothetical protein